MEGALLEKLILTTFDYFFYDNHFKKNVTIY